MIGIIGVTINSNTNISSLFVIYFIGSFRIILIIIYNTEIINMAICIYVINILCLVSTNVIIHVNTIILANTLSIIFFVFSFNFFSISYFPR